MKNPLLSFALAAAIFAISSGNVANAFQIGDFFQNAEVIEPIPLRSLMTLIKVSTTIKSYAANAPYAIKTVDVPKASFMSHVKTNLKGAVKKNAWYAAWFASMAAAGWAIDELTGQMSQTTVKNTGLCKLAQSPFPVIGDGMTPLQCAQGGAALFGSVFVSFL